MRKSILNFLIHWYEISDKPLPGWLDRACSRDISLGLDLDEERELTQQLKSTGHDPLVEPNPYLADRIIAHLDDSERARSGGFAWREIAIGVAACAVLAIVYQWIGNAPNSQETIIVDNGDPSLESVVDATDSLLANTGIFSENSDWKNPLDQEIEYVMDDAKGAIDFLADSFIPSSMRGSGKKS